MNPLKDGLLPLASREAKLPFGLLVRILLNNSKVLDTAARDFLPLDYLEVDTYLATLIESLDPNSELTYVQRNSQRTGAELKLPRVWNIAAWKVSYERYLTQKELSEANRQIGYIREAKLQELSKAIQRDAGLPEQYASVIARQIIAQVNLAGAKSFGVDISQLPPTPVSFLSYEMDL